MWVCPDVTVEVDVVARPQVVGVEGAAQAQDHRGRVWGTAVVRKWKRKTDSPKQIDWKKKRQQLRITMN